MRKALLVCIALSGTAVCQVAMPPHVSVYNGFSRGWSTTAQAGFAITQVDLPLDAMQAGDTASFLIRVNGTQVHHSTGHTVLPFALPAPVAVQPGDLLSVVGNWSPAVPGNFSAHNSYGNGGGTYSTPIEGVAHTLFRAGWQWDVGDPAFGGTGFDSATGSIGRVIIHTAPLTGFASKSTFGVGCYELPRMIYEQFPAGTTPNDLIGTSWSMFYVPSPAGGKYLVIPGGPAYDAVAAAANGVNLVAAPWTSTSSASWDDASVNKTLPIGLFPGGFPYPSVGSQSAVSICVNSNGKVYLGSTTDATFATNGSNYASIAPFQGTTGAGLPVLAAFNVDLDPTAGGSIWYEDPSPNGGVRITWAGVPNWQDPVGPPAVVCDVQMELLPGGQVNFAYGPSLGNGGSAANDIIVGYSAGGGEPVSPMIDWSTLAAANSGDGSIAVKLDADARPVIGTTFNHLINDVPAGAPFAGMLSGFTKFDPGIPLAAIGMDGCSQYASQDNVGLIIAPGASVTRPFQIPNNPAFAGITLINQVAVFAPGTVPNLLGASVSNGLELVIDVN